MSALPCSSCDVLVKSVVLVLQKASWPARQARVAPLSAKRLPKGGAPLSFHAKSVGAQPRHVQPQVPLPGRPKSRHTPEHIGGVTAILVAQSHRQGNPPSSLRCSRYRLCQNQQRFTHLLLSIGRRRQIIQTMSLTAMKARPAQHDQH